MNVVRYVRNHKEFYVFFSSFLILYFAQHFQISFKGQGFVLRYAYLWTSGGAVAPSLKTAPGVSKKMEVTLDSRGIPI